MKLDYLTLLRGKEILVNKTAHIRFPKLSEVADLGFETYNQYITMLIMNKDSMLQIFKIQKNDEVDKLTLFDIIFNIKGLRDIFYNIFSFFIAEELFVSIPYQCFYVKKKDENKINNVRLIYQDNFEEIEDLILQTNYVNMSDEKNLKPAGKHTEELLKKREKYKQKFANQNKNDIDISLANLISKLSTYNCGINLLNVWDYTIFQLFDQFFVMNNKRQIDMINMSYSVWGGEYKIPKWYESTFNKSK